MLETAVTLQMREKGFIDTTIQRQVDQLNNMLIRLVKTADNQCQKGRRGSIPSSPILNNVRGAIRILHLLCRRWKEQGKKSRPRMQRIKRLAQRHKYQGQLKYSSLEEIQEARRRMLRKYKDMKPYAQDYREIFLGRIADEMAQRDGKPLAQHFRTLMEREEMKQQFRQIKLAEGRPSRRGVNMIEREITNGGRIRVTDKVEMEQAIMEANRTKLLQASNTPLRMEPLQSLLGEQMEYEKWEEILKGNINVPTDELEEGTRLWYEFVSSQELSDFTISWTPEEYFDSWRQMKEDKSSAPGIHIGHLKCIDPQSDAAYVISTLALIPLQTGYAPEQWRIGIDSMIPKKLSDLRPEKLRLILLMDARFNHNNKLIGKKMLEYGERRNKLAEEQYGSRKDKSAIQHALNKRLILDHIRQYRKQAIYCANDARSCYDRILFIVAYLTLRIFGVPKEAARCSVDTICQMKHYVRTIFGDSTNYYGGDKWISEEGMFPHGNGQGNGNGPSLWSCISSPLLNILREEGFGIQFDNPITDGKLRISAIGFVDDMDYIQTQSIQQQHDMTSLAKQTQQGLNLWDGLLRTTGGSLEIAQDKTDFVAIDYAPRNGILTMKDAQVLQPLQARDTNGQYCQLTQLKITDARKTLGVYQSPTGMENAQFEYMLQKVIKWTGHNKRSNISKRDTLKALGSTIGRTLDYPLPATSLNESQCNKIMSAFLQTALPKMGYARTTPRKIVFAPVSMMGCGMKNLYVQQLIHHVMILVDHGNQGTVTSKLLNIVAESFYIEAGWSGDLFLADVSKISWISKTWLTDTINAMQQYRIRLIHNLPEPRKWKVGDFFIMELVLECKDFSIQERKWINEVRMHLQVMTLADITSSDGRYIKRNIYHGQRGFSCSSYAYKWPHAASPTAASLQAWRRALRKLFNMQESLKIDVTYVRTKWEQHSMAYWLWRLEPMTNILYQRDEDGQFTEWHNNPSTQRTRQQRAFFTKTTFRVPAISPLAIPVDVSMSDEELVYLESKGDMNTHNHLKKKKDDKTEDWAIRFVNLPEDKEKSYIMDVSRNKGKVVCDGSYKEGQASSAFVTISLEEATGGNIFPGSRSDQSAYRGELGGILGVVVFTKKLCKQFHIDQGSVTIGCDCQGAIAAVKKLRRVTSRWNSYDILSRIKKEIQTSNIHFAFKYIKGHQDSVKQADELDEWENANVKADDLAKQHLDDYGPVISGFLPKGDNLGMWVVCHDSQPIVCDIAQKLYTNIWQGTGQEFWLQKLGISNTLAECIDWSVISDVARLLPEYKRQRYIKVMADVAPVGKILHRRGTVENAHCPLCNCAEETSTHLWQCPNEHIQDIFSKGITRVREQLHQGPVVYISFILNQLLLLRGFHENDRTEVEQNGTYGQICLRQRKLGKWAALWGFYHKDMVNIIEDHFSGTRRSGTLWIAKTVIMLWEIYDEMWQYHNQVLHDKCDKKDTQTHEKINEEMQHLLQKAPPQRFLMVSERRLFSYTYLQLMNKPIRVKRKWIRDASIVIKKFYDETDNAPEVLKFRRHFSNIRKQQGDNIQTMDLTKDGS